jgi:hypothetical protein
VQPSLVFALTDDHLPQTGFPSPARDGLVLLVSSDPAYEITGRTLRLRISIWRKVILGGEAPTPYGIIPSVRTPAGERTKHTEARSVWRTSLAALHSKDASLSIELGGQRILKFSAE